MRQWEVARELRARVKAALDAAGVAPTGHDTIVVSAPPAITSTEERGTSDEGRRRLKGRPGGEREERK